MKNSAFFSVFASMLILSATAQARQFECTEQNSTKVILKGQGILTDEGTPEAYKMKPTGAWSEIDMVYDWVGVIRPPWDNSRPSVNTLFSAVNPYDRLNYSLVVKNEFMQAAVGARGEGKLTARNGSTTVDCVVTEASPNPTAPQTITPVNGGLFYGTDFTGICERDGHKLPSPRDYAAYAMARGAKGILESSLPPSDRWLIKYERGQRYDNEALRKEIRNLPEGYQVITYGNFPMDTEECGYKRNCNTTYVDFYYSREGYTAPFNDREYHANGAFSTNARFNFFGGSGDFVRDNGIGYLRCLR